MLSSTDVKVPVASDSLRQSENKATVETSGGSLESNSAQWLLCLRCLPPLNGAHLQDWQHKSIRPTNKPISASTCCAYSNGALREYWDILAGSRDSVARYGITDYAQLKYSQELLFRLLVACYFTNVGVSHNTKKTLFKTHKIIRNVSNSHKKIYKP